MQIPQTKSLEPYFKMATEEAKKSPCHRRQYGAVIANQGPTIYHIVRTNSRVTNCCGNRCIRTDLGLINGERTEVGAEVHAETACIIDAARFIGEKQVFMLVGFAGAQELLSEAVYPCYSCARNIKYAGFNYIYIRNRTKEIVPVSIHEIIQYREKEWLSDEHDG